MGFLKGIVEGRVAGEANVADVGNRLILDLLSKDLSRAP
jgi:hypothetical protein